ncbi:MAG TPA: helix-hairpin-helix domain-containing protein, partial [bacterium]|nr:helix-hairpin-helix domain-containing protein [bacterium]
AQNIFDAVAASKKTTFARLIFAIGIRNVGEQTAKLLARRFADMAHLAAATADELMTVREVGPEIAASIVDFFRDPKNMAVIDKLFAAGVSCEREKEAAGGYFAGQTFVFTGTLQGMTREQAQELVERCGGHAASSVSKKTNWVVAGAEAGSKAEKAKKLGVPLIGEDDFRKMCSDGGIEI